MFKNLYKKIIITLIIVIFSLNFTKPVYAFNFNFFNKLLNKQETKELKSIKNFPQVNNRQPKYTMWVLATAYSSDVGQTDDSPCIPAMSRFNLCEYYNKYQVNDTIAANFLPLGAKVKLPDIYGDRIITVRDRMNKRYNGTVKIDIWMPNREQAIKFGVRWIKMEVF